MADKQGKIEATRPINDLSADSRVLPHKQKASKKKTTRKGNGKPQN